MWHKVQSGQERNVWVAKEGEGYVDFLHLHIDHRCFKIMFYNKVLLLTIYLNFVLCHITTLTICLNLILFKIHLLYCCFGRKNLS